MLGFARGFREVVQDLLIPELRAIQAQVQGTNQRLDALAEDMARRFETVERRFEHQEQRFDGRFEQMLELQERRFEQVDQRFERVHAEILGLAQAISRMDGKLDILVSHVVDYKDAVRLSARLEDLEKQVTQIAARLEPPGPSGSTPG